MLKLENVTVKYKDKTVLDDLSLSASGGEIIGLVAPNGTGKTTLFNVIANFLKPNKGTVIFQGNLRYKTERQQIAIHKQLATLPDQDDLFEELTGVEHMKLYADMWRSTKKVEEVYTSLQMEGYVKKKVKTYSLGMRQRLCFAMLSCADTPIMLMDEVMNGLDVANVALISKQLIDMREEGKLLFIASHLLTNLDLYSDRVLYLKGGDIIHEQNAANKDEQYIKTDISLKDYEILSATYPLPAEHLFIANHLLCMPTLLMTKEEIMEWMLRLTQDNQEVTIGPLGTLEYYERYYHEDEQTDSLGSE